MPRQALLLASAYAFFLATETLALAPASGDRQAVELARYLLRIEADTGQAWRVLQGVLRNGQDPVSQAQAQALVGEIQSARGENSIAANHMRQALESGSLPRRERTGLLRKLLRLDPQAVQSLQALPTAPGPVNAAHALRWNPRQAFLLEIPADARDLSPLWLQDSLGNLQATLIALTPAQTFLDAAGPHVLIYDSEKRALIVLDFAGRPVKEYSVPVKPEAALLLNAQGNAMTWLEGSRLHFFRQDRERSELLVEGSCSLHAESENKESAMLLCSDQALYRADFGTGQVKSMGRLAERPLALMLQGDCLLLQYADHLEVRRGPRFDAFSWGFPCQLQDRLVLGKSSVYLIDPKGGLNAFDLRTGQSVWRRNLMAQDILPIGDEILVTTFARTLEAIDAQGRTLWTYAYGWVNDPVLLPGDRRVTLHYGDGHRLRIDLEVAKAAERPGDLLLRGLMSQAGATPQQMLGRLENLLSLEPGLGDAWRQRYLLDRQLNAPPKQITQDLVQAARSSLVPAWSNHPLLKTLATQMDAAWLFKREYGPKYYPTLVPGHDLAFYLESDNQTLVILDPARGTLVNSYRFAEELDLKAALWQKDTLCVSSSSRLYLVSPWRQSGLLAQIPLHSPLCQAISTPQGLVLSDWQGNLRLMRLSTGEVLWEKSLGRGGLLLSKPNSGDIIDVVDLDGRYFAIDAPTGKTLGQLDLPEGTPFELQSLGQSAAIAMAQGRLIGVGRQNPRLLWQRDLGEQIFSLSGNRMETMVVTTASKRVLCLRALDGGVLSDQHLSAYLFNRPLVLADAFWLGTTDPALEQHGFRGEKRNSHLLTDLPGSPVAFRHLILIGTLDHLLTAFPADSKNSQAD